MTGNHRTLEEQKEEFKSKKLLASPIAGLIAWLIVAISGIFFPDNITVWVLFIATGSIVYLSMGVSKAYNFFLEKFEEVDERGQIINSLHSLFEHFEKICSAIVVRISVDSMESAFVLFESINNRGVPLTPIDLIKNMLISNLVKNSQDANNINERWQNIVRNVDSYDDQVRFLRHFYHAYKGNPAIGLAKYTKAIKTNIIRIYTTLIEKNSQYILDQLVEKSKTYSAIIAPEKIEDNNDLSKNKEL